MAWGGETVTPKAPDGVTVRVAMTSWVKPFARTSINK
jgi:hypothetical protein